MDAATKKAIAQTKLEDWIDNIDVIHILHISSRTLQTLRTNGTIPYSRINNKIYYRRQDIQQILADNYQPIAIDLTKHGKIIK
ncbi:MAG: helix-turn-helix domain-containing protein [Bacteroidales bacterium]|nr:helix-turn-helix domain-containing protein [Bacteroidales bacterium]